MVDGNGIQTGVAEIEGACLYYELAGEGPTLVLVQAHFRVLRFDMRGFGNSPMTPGPFSNRQDLYGLLGFLGIERAHLVACSMGAMTVIDFALEHP